VKMTLGIALVVFGLVVPAVAQEPGVSPDAVAFLAALVTFTDRAALLAVPA
jgi:hypothetical protein